MLTEYCKSIMYSRVLYGTAVDYLMASYLNPLCQHYAGLPKLPIMPKAMPAYCACPHLPVHLSVPQNVSTWLWPLQESTDHSFCVLLEIHVRSKSVNVVENHFPQFSHTRQNPTISATAVLACAFPFYCCKEYSKLYSVTKGSMIRNKEIVLSQSWLISW